MSQYNYEQLTTNDLKQPYRNLEDHHPIDDKYQYQFIDKTTKPDSNNLDLSLIDESSKPEKTTNDTLEKYIELQISRHLSQINLQQQTLSSTLPTLPKTKKIKTNNECRPSNNETPIKTPTSRCLNCKPRGLIKQHIIGISACGLFLFHHDIKHRPLILLTPICHITHISEMPANVLKLLFDSIKNFCLFWSITDYTISFTETSEHLKVKIITNENIIKRMRGDFFRKIAFDKKYDQLTKVSNIIQE